MTQTMIDNCDILVGNPGKHVELNRPNLKAILLNSAGSDYYIQEGVLHAATRLANASGSYGKAIAEHTLSLIHISEPTRQAEISYAVFCLKKKKKKNHK